MIKIEPDDSGLQKDQSDISQDIEKILMENLAKEVRNWLESLGFSQTASYIIFLSLIKKETDLKEVVEQSNFTQPAISQRSVQLEELGIISRTSLPRNKGLKIELRPLEQIIKGLIETKFETPLRSLLDMIVSYRNQQVEKGNKIQSQNFLRLEKELGKLLDLAWAFKKIV